MVVALATNRPRRRVRRDTDPAEIKAVTLVEGSFEEVID
jgi:hypothetical protein